MAKSFETSGGGAFRPTGDSATPAHSAACDCISAGWNGRKHTGHSAKDDPETLECRGRFAEGREASKAAPNIAATVRGSPDLAIASYE